MRLVAVSVLLVLAPACSDGTSAACPNDGRSNVLLCGIAFPMSIAVDETHVYVAGSTSLLVVDKEGTAAPLSVEAPQTRLGVFDGTVYWWEGAGVAWFTDPEDSKTKNVVSIGNTQNRRFVDGGARVAWVSELDGELVEFADGGGRAIITGLETPSHAALTATSLFVVASSQAGPSSRVLVFPRDGGVATVALSLTTKLSNVAARPEAVYVSGSRCDGTSCVSWLGRVVPGSGQLEELVSGIAGPVRGLLVDADHMYWSERDAVRRAALDGTEIVTIIDGLRSPAGIARDNEYLYVVETGLSGDASVPGFDGRVHVVPVPVPVGTAR